MSWGSTWERPTASLSYTPLDADAPDIRELQIPQLVDAGTLERRTMLPVVHVPGGGA